MLASKGKISTRQAIILFFMMTVSPAIRIFPQFAAREAGKAGWLIPIVAIIPFILLIYLLNTFFRHNGESNLTDIFCKVLGKVLGRILVFFYLLWILILTSLYIRYYAERILTSIMPNTSIFLLIIVMLALVFVAAKDGIVVICRTNEFYLYIFIITISLIIVLGLPQIKFRNLMMVSYRDAWPVAKASYSFYALWGYVLYVFFFADKINDKENIKKFGLQVSVLMVVASMLSLIMVIGALGSTLTAHFSLPFFVVVKSISIFGTIERIESVLLALWIITDFILIAALTYSAASIIKTTFNFSSTKFLISPIVILTGVGSMFLAGNRFELEQFTNNIAMHGNIIFEYIIPLIVFGIGKVRKCF